MNPSGIVFGPNAKLDIGGSAVFTSAPSLDGDFEDSFGISTTQEDVNNGFSVDSVTSFGFFGTVGQPGTISVNGSTLVVSSGKTLALVGGDITISGGHLLAPDGAVRVTSVGLDPNNGGRVNIDPTTSRHIITSSTPVRFITLGQAPFGKDAVINTGSSGQVQLNGEPYNGTNTTNFINPQPVNIVIANGSILVGNLPSTRLIVSSPSVLPPFPTNNDTSTPSLSNLSAVATASRPSPHQLIMASDRCSGSEKGAFSSFVPPGRDAARPQPGGPLASPPYLEDEIPHITEIPIQSTVRIAGTRNLASGATAFLLRIGGC
jgi:hypothetical protein